MIFFIAPSGGNNSYICLKLIGTNIDGMTTYHAKGTHSDEKQIINFFSQNNSLNRIVIYACTSGYPVPFNQTCLLEISRLIETYSDKVKSIGFSGHHLGIAVDLVAYTLGAEWVERHFTLDRTWKGTDHSASLEPAGLKKLARDLKAAYRSLTYKRQEILDIEEVQRDKLKFRRR